jgi:hypothetical protein
MWASLIETVTPLLVNQKASTLKVKKKTTYVELSLFAAV